MRVAPQPDLGQTVCSIHGKYLDTLVYTPGEFFMAHFLPNDVMPICVYMQS